MVRIRVQLVLLLIPPNVPDSATGPPFDGLRLPSSTVQNMLKRRDARVAAVPDLSAVTSVRVCGSSDLQGRTQGQAPRSSPPHRVARRADASSLAVVHDALQHPSRGLPHRASPPRGENPGRFRGALLRRSPPRSSAAQLTLRTLGSTRPLRPGREALEKQTLARPS